MFPVLIGGDGVQRGPKRRDGVCCERRKPKWSQKSPRCLRFTLDQCSDCDCLIEMGANINRKGGGQQVSTFYNETSLFISYAMQTPLMAATLG